MEAILDFTKPHVLRDEAEYDAAVQEIDQLLDADPSPGSDDYERLEFLSVLVRAYEDDNVPFEDASPQQVIDFMLEQQGKTRGDLADLMGGRSRVSDFYKGKRPLSLTQIKRLNSDLGIPADLLLQAAD